MKGFKSVFRYGVLSAKDELRSVNLYLVMLFAFFLIQWSLGGLPDYLAESKGQMHVFELYVHFLSSRGSQTIYLLGIMSIACGSLFYSGGAAYYLIRGNRRRWALGQVLYLLLVTAGYNLFLLFSFCFSTGGHLTLANQWSRASVLAEQFGVKLIGGETIFHVDYSVLQMSPAAAGLLTFLLSVLVGTAAGMIMICFGMRNRGIYGAAILAIAWYADILLDGNRYLPKAMYLSLFDLSRISWLLDTNGSAMIRYAVVFYCILIAMEFCILLRSVEKVDFVKLE